MILENGDFFVTDSTQRIHGEGGVVEIPDMFEGIVFQAMEVSGDWVAARVVERSMKDPPYITSIKWKNRNIQSVSKKYGEFIENSRSEDTGKQPDFSELMEDMATLIDPESRERDEKNE